MFNTDLGPRFKRARRINFLAAILAVVCINITPYVGNFRFLTIPLACGCVGFLLARIENLRETGFE